MASVVNDPNGRKRIQFVDGNNERKSIRLGKATVKAAESFRLRVEALLADKALGRPHDAELCEWLNQRPDKVYERLARVGLVPPRTRKAVVTLGNLLDRFEAAAVVKPATRAAYRQTTNSLREHFGPDTPLASLTAADADD